MEFQRRDSWLLIEVSLFRNVRGQMQLHGEQSKTSGIFLAEMHQPMSHEEEQKSICRCRKVDPACGLLKR